MIVRNAHATLPHAHIDTRTLRNARIIVERKSYLLNNKLCVLQLNEYIHTGINEKRMMMMTRRRQTPNSNTILGLRCSCCSHQSVGQQRRPCDCGRYEICMMFNCVLSRHTTHTYSVWCTLFVFSMCTAPVNTVNTPIPKYIRSCCLPTKSDQSNLSKRIELRFVFSFSVQSIAIEKLFATFTCNSFRANENDTAKRNKAPLFSVRRLIVSKRFTAERTKFTVCLFLVLTLVPSTC